MDRNEKTHRTLYIEEHHERLQRETRANEQWSRIMANPAPKTPKEHKKKIARHRSHGHMLFNHHDSHHWANVSSGASFDEYDEAIRDSFAN